MAVVPSSKTPTKGLVLAVGALAFGSSLQCGFISSVLNLPQKPMQLFVNASHEKLFGNFLEDSQSTWIWSSIVTQRQIGQVVGCVICPFLSSQLGRKRTLILNSIPLLLGLILQFSSGFLAVWPLLLIGRFIWAFGCGIAETMVPVFFTEVSPKVMRGSISSMHGISVGLGILLSLCFSLPSVLLEPAMWPHVYIIPMIPVVVQAAVLIYVPESPKELFTKGSEHRYACLCALQFYHGYDADHKATLQEFELETASLLSNKKQLSMGLLAVLRNKSLHVALFVALLSNVAYVFGGMPVIITYTAEIFYWSGAFNSLAVFATIGIGFLCFMASIPALWVLDRFGRRPILLFSLCGCAICICFCIVAQFCYKLHPYWTWPAYLSVGSTILYIALFSLGVQTVTTFLPSELVPTAERPTVQTMAVCARFTTACVISILFLPLQRRVGAWAWLELLVPLSIVTGLLAYFMPETKNRNVNEILQSCNRRRLPIKKSGNLSSAALAEE